MANFIGFLVARRIKAAGDVRQDGMGEGGQLTVYVSRETHTWVQKAADLFGLGTDAIRWIDTDDDLRMDMAALENRIAADRAAGDQPFLVVGTAGSVSTGAVDPLPAIAALCRAQDLWFHVDGAYGGFAVVSDDAPADLAGLREADSIAVDAHKWLHAPLEAGCAMVRDRALLRDTFAYHPPYYHYPTVAGEELVHFHEYGPQNSRSFRALKVWLILRQLGRDGYVELVERDLEHARAMAECLAASPDIETVTRGLTITTFRYVPADLSGGGAAADEYLDRLNAELMARVQKGGEAYFSNAVIGGRFVLRACITNFRTTLADVQALPGIVSRYGAALDAEMRRGEKS